MTTPRLSRGFFARAQNRAHRRPVVSSLVFTAVIVGSCNLHNPGVTAPTVALSYPSALALSREVGVPPLWLYIANSNFDLRYNSGSMQSYDLTKLDSVLASNRCRDFGKLPSGDGGTRSFADSTNYSMLGLLDAGQGTVLDDAGASSGDGGASPGISSLDAGRILLPADYGIVSNYGNARGFLCDGEDPAGFEGCCLDTEAELKAVLHDAHQMDSFAVGVAVAPNNDRVYVPLSGRNQLVYFDLDNGNLGCDGETRCRRGPDRKSDDNVPDDTFPGQLSEITIGQLKDLVPAAQANGFDTSWVYMATTHELGAVGLFVVPPALDEHGNVVNGVPILDATVRGLGVRPRSVMADKRTNFIYVTSAGESFISRVGVRINPNRIEGRDGPRELLYESSRITVSGVSQPNDLRDLAIDPQDPNKLYALIRGTQESVAFLELDSTLPATNARLVDEVRIGAGPSKMILIEQDGKSFLLVTCYDNKAVYVIDVATHLLAAVVRSFSGPFSMVYDASRKLLHVADFRASILRVVDLKGLTDKNEPPPRIVATIGSPQFEGALQ